MLEKLILCFMHSYVIKLKSSKPQGASKFSIFKTFMQERSYNFF